MADTENGKLEYPCFLFFFSLFSNIVSVYFDENGVPYNVLRKYYEGVFLARMACCMMSPVY
jgi:hypothetical protein